MGNEEKGNVNISLEREFANNTSCHGLKNVADDSSSNVLSRSIWSVLVVAAFSFLVYQVVSAGLEYAEYNAVSEVNLQVSFQNVNCHISMDCYLKVVIWVRWDRIR